MPIDIHRRLLFVHIPRTGGTSIECAFALRKREHFHGSSRDLGWYVGTNKTLQHLTWRELAKILPQEFLATAFKFSFVRNPWDRFLSVFLWHQTGYLRHSNTPGASSNGVLHLDERYMQSMDHFVKLLELPDEKRIDVATGLGGHLETQCSFLRDDRGQIVMDMIGRFERFSEDLQMIADRAGISLSATPHMYKSDRLVDYRGYYSSYARAAVHDFYRDDVIEFGYVF